MSAIRLPRRWKYLWARCGALLLLRWDWTRDARGAVRWLAHSTASRINSSHFTIRCVSAFIRQQRARKNILHHFKHSNHCDGLTCALSESVIPTLRWLCGKRNKIHVHLPCRCKLCLCPSPWLAKWKIAFAMPLHSVSGPTLERLCCWLTLVFR